MTCTILPSCQSLYIEADQADTHPPERGLLMAEVQGLTEKGQG
jgi:hypothetical protein